MSSNMDGIIIGARILDVLTTGMYPNALDAIREYVQNAYDAIRRAERAGILLANHGDVSVIIKTAEKELIVRDNGIGIPHTEAPSTLLSIGASKKKIGDDAGFRGIGRLAGLAYCDKLIFSTAYMDEPIITEVTFDAYGIRKNLESIARSAENETASDLLRRMTTCRTKDRAPGAPFFEIKLIGVNPKACSFLDPESVRDYLRQVAPVEFNMQAFIYGRAKINPFLDKFGARRFINLSLICDGTPECVHKAYKTFHEAGNKKQNRVEIVDIETMIDPSDNPRWIAWLSKARDLKGAITMDEVKGIRFRSNNILIGDHKTFSRIFEKVQKSYGRMNGYYSGEVYIIDPNIIPNSRRDFFEDNEAWREAERTLIEWARPLVKRVYQNVDERKRDPDLVEMDADSVFDEIDRESRQGFATESHRNSAIDKIKEQEDKLKRAMTPERTEEELAALQKKRDEAAARRERLAKPRPLVDESQLNRDERRILRLVLDMVQKVCGDDLATKVALEVDKRLRAKREKKGKADEQELVGADQ